MPLTALQIEATVRNALLEDLQQGDVTTDFIPALNRPGQGEIRTRQDCVVSGLLAAQLAFQGVDSAVQFTPQVQEGSSIAAGTVLAVVSGRVASLLKAERTALNFLQHLSGIATETHRYVTALAGSNTRITDTRKTTPGLRLLEKQAVIDGGGSPHRYNLGSCVMLKDNHIEALGDLHTAVKTLRPQLSHTMKIEVEVEDLAGVEAALAAGADVLLLDNMSPAQVREAVARIGQRAITEASGGISLETVRAYAEAGVQYISTSKITLGAPAIDIGLDFQER